MTRRAATLRTDTTDSTSSSWLFISSSSAPLSLVMPSSAFAPSLALLLLPCGSAASRCRSGAGPAMLALRSTGREPGPKGGEDKPLSEKEELGATSL
jgi:hypothetical protein